MLSFTENITTILRAISESNAKSILDVGGGMGKYAILIRENDISSQAERGDMEPNRSIKINCCEDTEYFIKQEYHQYLYDSHTHISVFDKEEFTDELTIFIDTIEHWSKEKTLELFNKINGRILISTPKNTVMYTEHYYGDDRHHMTQWTQDDFVGWKDYSTPQSYIFLR